jgi:glycosidase
LAFFDKDEIEWSENVELHRFYKTLLQLRKNNLALYANKKIRPIMIHGSLGATVLAFYRKMGDEIVLVFLNLSDAPVHYYFSAVGLQGRFRNVFTNEIVEFTNDGSVFIGKAGYVVLEKLAL